MVGRYGGEEFLLLLPETDLDGARTVAEKVRGQLECTVIGCPEGCLHVTSSLGVVTGDGLESLESLLRRADAALYRAKEIGRNRVVAGEEVPGDAMERECCA